MKPEELLPRMDELLEAADRVEHSHYVLQNVIPADRVDQE